MLIMAIPYQVEDFDFMPDAESAIKHAHDLKLPIFIVTNQGGIGLGYFDIAAMRQFHDHMLAKIIMLVAILWILPICSHHPRRLIRRCGYDCRKPKTGDDP